MKTRTGAFTLVELLVVIAIMLIMVAVVVPSMIGLMNAGNINSAAYQFSDVLQSARSYATANNTYVWVGLFEETQTSPAVPGTGQIVISVVASSDGTMIYTTGSFNPQQLIQINKLVKLPNMHLTAASASSTVFLPGTGTNTGGSLAFLGRPAVTGTVAQIGYPPSSGNPYPFPYPVGSPQPPTKYTFNEMIEFNPRGEARVNNSTNPLFPVMEIGLQPTHGTAVDASNPNVVALQITGVGGNVTIYRK